MSIPYRAMDPDVRPLVHPSALVDRLWWGRDDMRTLLIKLAQEDTPHFIYHLPTVAQQCKKLLDMSAVDRVFYAMKANAHLDILRLLDTMDIPFECVSKGELAFVLHHFPQRATSTHPYHRPILFTPNFAPKEEYAFALAHSGILVTLDSLYPLQHWPDLLRGQTVALRIDPVFRDGHHEHVKTSGVQSKFGIAVDDVPLAISLANELDVKIVALHCHVGSGIRTTSNWRKVFAFLQPLLEGCKHVKAINVGGGLGILDTGLEEENLSLEAVNDSLACVRELAPGIEVWMEPGRFIVSESGVLLSKVTQIKVKGDHVYVGIDAGFNSLVRPILYSAYHHIANLTSWESSDVVHCDVVGPICESGDIVGADRHMTHVEEGDVVIVANAGAYCYSMASEYNMRGKGRESTIE